jgi:hypothetical protein
VDARISRAADATAAKRATDPFFSHDVKTEGPSRQQGPSRFMGPFRFIRFFDRA